MGREIRRVPANWEHPQEECRHWPRCQGDELKHHYHPIYDGDFETRAREWLDNCIAWDNGTHKVLQERPELKEKCPYFWQWDGNPPDADYYHPKWESAEWYQVYETVSEGTPTTPPFATKEELIDYLVEHGDFWDQERGEGGWLRENAKQFVEREWAPF